VIFCIQATGGSKPRLEGRLLPGASLPGDKAAGKVFYPCSRRGLSTAATARTVKVALIACRLFMI